MADPALGIADGVEVEVRNQRRGGVRDIRQIEDSRGEAQAEKRDRGIDGAEFGARVDLRAAFGIAAGEMGQEAGRFRQAKQRARRLADLGGHRFPVEDAFRGRGGAGQGMEAAGADRVEHPGRQVGAVAGQAALRVVAAAQFAQRDPEQPFLVGHRRPLHLETDARDFHRAAGLGHPVGELQRADFRGIELEAVAGLFAGNQGHRARPADQFGGVRQLDPQFPLAAGIDRHRHHAGADLRRAAEAGHVGRVEHPVGLGRQPRQRMPGPGPLAVRLGPDCSGTGVQPALARAHPAEVRAEVGEVVEGVDHRRGVTQVAAKRD